LLTNAGRCEAAGFFSFGLHRETCHEILQTNFPFGPAPTSSPVPEPTGLLIALISATGLVLVGKKARRARSAS
jgi:hypothetical protein